MWPDTFGLACCAIEMMSIVSSRYDIARFGMEPFRGSPRQADLLIVSGRVSHKMAAPLRQIYDQMLEPKWVIAMGACASSGGMFNNYAIVQSVDKIVPVDIYVPGCPPRPEQLIEGIIRLHEAVQGRRPARVRDPERRLVSELGGRSRLVERRRGERHRETTLVVDPARASSRPARTCATRRASTSSPTSPPSTTSAGATRACPATSAPPAGRDLNAPMTQGFQVVPLAKPKRFAVNYHLLSVSRPAAPGARADLARRGRGRPDRDPGLADGRLARARGLGPDGHPVRGPPEPEADPAGRRLGRAPAAQGLSDRRRARPLLSEEE